jgi:hypothetical protein
MAENSRGNNWRGNRPAPKPGVPPRPSKSSGKKALLPVLGILLVIAGVLYGIYLKGGSKTELYGISIVLDALKDPHWPVPAWARQDGERLLPPGALANKPFQEQSRGSILVKLGEANQNAGDLPVFIFLMAQVIIQSDGPHLITSEAQSLDPDRRTLPLVEVLDKLRKLDRNVLLALDLRTTRHPWLTGMGSLDAWETYAFIENYYKQPTTGKLATLCYCQSGQPPLVNNEWHGGIFALALQEALNGQANGWGRVSKGDVNVTSDELAYYVKERVNVWCQQAGIEAELPRYHGVPEFVVRTSTASRLGEITTGFDPPVYPAELTKAWKGWEDRLRTSHYDRAPLAHRRLEAALLRTETRWLSMPSGADEVKQLLADFKPEQDRFQKLIATIGKQPVVSVFMIAPPTLTDEQRKVVQPLDDVLQKWAQLPGMKPEEWDGLAKSLKDIFTNHSEYAAGKLTSALYSASEINIVQLRRMAGLMTQVKPSYVEFQMVRFLDSLPDDQLDRWKAHFRLLLDPWKLAEQAVPDDPRAWRMLSKQLIAIDKRFQTTLLDLANTDLISTERAERLKILQDIKKLYSELIEIGQTLEMALQERDACQAELPALVEYEAVDPVQSTSIQTQWDQLIPLVKQLMQKMSPPETLTLEWAGELRAVAERVRERRPRLIEARQNLPRTSPGHTTLNTLEVSRWKSDERQGRLTAALSSLREKLKDGLSPLEKSKVHFLETNQLEQPRVSPQQYHQLRRALHLLELAGHPVAPTLDTALKELSTRYDSQLALKVRQLLGSVWTTTTTQLVPSQRLWYVPCFGEDAEKDPVFQDSQEAFQQKLSWLASTRLEGWAASFEKINKDIALNLRDLAEKVRRAIP